MSASDAEKAAPKEDLEALRDVLTSGSLVGEKLSVLGLVVRALADEESLSRFLESILADVQQAAAALGCDLGDQNRNEDAEKLFRIHRKVEAVRHILDRAFDAGIFSEVSK